MSEHSTARKGLTLGTIILDFDFATNPLAKLANRDGETGTRHRLLVNLVRRSYGNPPVHACFSHSVWTTPACQHAQVPFFFKQWGGVRKSKAGRELDGTTYDGVPHREQMPVLEQTRRLAAIAEFEALYQHAQGASETSLFSDREATRT